MIVRVVRPTGGGKTLTGPADLAKYGDGDTLYVSDVPERELARWSVAIGLYVIRGGEVAR